MGRNYLGNRENKWTSLQARSPLVMKQYVKLHCVHETNVFSGNRIWLADRRDLGDRDHFCRI